MLVILVLIVSISIFILRILPHFLRKDLLFVDHFYHLIYSNEIVKNGFHYPKKIEQFLVTKDGLSYPFLYHYFISLFPQKLREKIVHYLAGIFDAIQFLMLALLIINLSHHFNWDDRTIKTIVIATGGVFATYPILMRLGDARNIAASARSLGELFFTACVLSIYLFLENGNTIYIITSITFGALIFLSSKFAAQSFLFFSLLFSLFYLKIIFLGIFIFSLILAIVVSGGGYLRVLNAHIAHSNMQRKINHTANSNFRKVIQFPQNVFKNTKEAFEDLYKFPLFSIIIHSPLLLVIIYFLIVDFNTINQNHFYSFFYFLGVFSIISCFLTSFRLFRFLGEAERYGDYSVFAISLIIPVYLINQHPEINIYYIFAPFLLWHLILYSVVLFGWLKIMPSDSNVKPVIKYLNTFTKSNVAIIPVNLSYQISYQTQHNVLFNVVFSDKIFEYNEEMKLFNELYYKYPLLNRDLDFLIKKYKIDFYVVKKNYSYMSASSQVSITELYSFESFKKIFENDEYLIYSV